MAITVKIAGVDRTDYVLANSFSIIDELTSRVNSASFIFICNSKTVAPTAGETVLIEEGTTKLFSGRILSKVESFFPPDRLKYQIECIDNTRDLDKKLVIETYLNQTAGDVIKDIIDNYTTGFTYANVSDGPTITKIAFDYVQVSEAITKIAEATGYKWYVDYDKDLYFFLKTDYPAPFELNDNQAYYKDLVIDYDISQLRNRVYVKSEKYETLDFTELFIGDGATVTWTCKYQATATPSPSATLDDVAKTVGWDGVDDPALFDFMLNASTRVLSLGTEGTPADGAELVITYGADQAIIIRWDDEDSIDAVKAIEGGDGIFEHCITDNNIDTKEWAIDVAKADLLQNADPIIKGIFTTDSAVLRSGQIITLNSTKRNINQNFLIQRIELMRILPVIAYPSIPYKPAATATVGYKTAATATEGYKSSTTGEMIYYIYQVTIATKLKGLEDLILDLLYQSNESLKRDTEAPAVPTNLALSTGMGEYTQASLAWIKAEWDANTEDDFSHYELKYKKTAYSDFGLVTTTNTTFLFISLEQNVEYQVYICSVDIYGNRSAWSSVESQTTATDTDTPAQVAGATATALLAGIKVTWIKASENNIEGYKVERQESDDGTTWVGAWTEVVRITSTLWLDLLLTYTKFYRYRISTITQTGIAGATSTPTADSIAPNKAGTNDLVARSITADIVALNSLTANLYNELRNTYVFNGDDSLDASFPFELDFEIVSEMTAINSVKLSFRLSQFRAYSTGVPSGGGHTTPSGGGHTSASESGTPVPVITSITSAGAVTNVGDENRSGFLPSSYDGSHAPQTSHTHTVSSHTHTVSNHTHSLTFGIYEDSQSPTIHYHIDNGSGYGGASGNFTTDQLDIDITGNISGTGFKRIKFDSNARCRIRAWVLCKIDLSA